MNNTTDSNVKITKRLLREITQTGRPNRNFQAYVIKEWNDFYNWLRALERPKPSPSEPLEDEWKKPECVKGYVRALVIAEAYNLTAYNRITDAIKLTKNVDGQKINHGRLFLQMKALDPSFELTDEIKYLYDGAVNRFKEFCLEQRAKLDEIENRIGYRHTARR